MGRWLLLLFVLGLLFAGAQGVTNRSEERRWRVISWIMLAVAIPIVVATRSRWAKFVPAIFAYSALRVGFLSFDGRSAADPAPVSVAGYVLVYLIVLVSVFLSARYARKRNILTLVDRLCLLAAVAFLVFGAARADSRAKYLGRSVTYYNDFVLTFTLVLACLAIAWSYHHLTHRGRRAVHKQRRGLTAN